MRTHIFLASLGLLARARGDSKFDCGTDTAHASDDFIKTVQSLHSGAASGSLASRAALYARDPAPITIDTVFHIVAKESTKSSITDDMPKAQLDSLNESYSPYSMTFNLINVTWTTNDDWAVGGGDPDTAMKKALRQGTYSTLNLYFQTDLAGGVLGKCTLPSAVANGKSDPTVYWSDGCNINAHTMPAGAMAGYNAGKTAVHETGHWMGLLHTFEGYSCEGDGDFIDDTPMEKTATDGCPKDPVKRSCPEQQGNGDPDPIHNYMDYSIDSCYEGFTALQVQRMKSMWGMYRQGN
ncbi:hypothetical protein T440DRAFT_207061 [Plenodomus tracheiphilus IPT5]|uniref:Peptidase M43 pregnancy-associated plasma-A domain-containing protein n=1 Tax=Plenodomus tracheiphilus IPT5 TaxID=1408161 RepID=A0A6A7BII5_9PLEO|nr:hypothetical protein T440DRAFT_207061 [Plenodomus tracheiphilus IPT5]